MSTFGLFQCPVGHSSHFYIATIAEGTDPKNMPVSVPRRAFISFLQE